MPARNTAVGPVVDQHNDVASHPVSLATRRRQHGRNHRIPLLHNIIRGIRDLNPLIEQMPIGSGEKSLICGNASIVPYRPIPPYLRSNPGSIDADQARDHEFVDTEWSLLACRRHGATGLHPRPNNRRALHDCRQRNPAGDRNGSLPHRADRNALRLASVGRLAVAKCTDVSLRWPMARMDPRGSRRPAGLKGGSPRNRRVRKAIQRARHDHPHRFGSPHLARTDSTSGDSMLTTSV